jgi:hypothetical protein
MRPPRAPVVTSQSYGSGRSSTCGSRNLYDAVGKLQRNNASEFALLNSKNEMLAVLLTTEAYVNS